MTGWIFLFVRKTCFLSTKIFVVRCLTLVKVMGWTLRPGAHQWQTVCREGVRSSMELLLSDTQQKTASTCPSAETFRGVLHPPLPPPASSPLPRISPRWFFSAPLLLPLAIRPSSALRTSLSRGCSRQPLPRPRVLGLCGHRRPRPALGRQVGLGGRQSASTLSPGVAPPLPSSRSRARCERRHLAAGAFSTSRCTASASSPLAPAVAPLARAAFPSSIACRRRRRCCCW